MADQDGVEAFEIGEDDELLQRGVVADVAVGIGVGVAPLFRSLAEKGDVEEIRLAGVGEAGLGFGDSGGNERLLDRVGVDAVVDLGKGALEVPIKLEAVVFLVLEALELLDEVEFEFRTEPRTEFKGDVLVGVGATVAASTRNQPFGSGEIDPLLRGKEKAVASGFVLNSLEFEGIKLGIVDVLPDPKKENSVLVFEPLLD